VPVDSYGPYRDWLTGVAESAGFNRWRIIDEPRQRSSVTELIPNRAEVTWVSISAAARSNPSFLTQNLPPGRGERHFAVEFGVDAGMRLTVTATNLRSGRTLYRKFLVAKLRGSAVAAVFRSELRLRASQWLLWVSTAARTWPTSARPHEVPGFDHEPPPGISFEWFRSAQNSWHVITARCRNWAIFWLQPLHEKVRLLTRLTSKLICYIVIGRGPRVARGSVAISILHAMQFGL